MVERKRKTNVMIDRVRARERENDAQYVKKSAMRERKINVWIRSL
jgi:hypothetical protein